MIKLWFVPEVLVFVREMSLKFDFWGRHAWIICITLNLTADSRCKIFHLMR